MPTGPVDLVTVSREYGSGGSDFARALGALLDWPVLDRDIASRAARRLALDPATVELLDELPPSRLSRLASALLITPPESPTLLETTRVLRPDAVAEAVHAAIVEAAQAPPVIVVGHGAQCIFRARAGTLHVRLVAPLEERVRRLGERLRCDASAAAAQARRMDEGRRRYVQRYYGSDWNDPLLYDLQINTARVPIAEAAALVGRLVRGGDVASESARAHP